MSERAGQLIGKSTLDAARFVVEHNPAVDIVYLRDYVYVPDQPSLKERTVPITRYNFLHTDQVETLSDALLVGHNFSLSSHALLQGKHDAHFLLMDLAPRKSPEAHSEIVKKFKEKIAPEFGGGFLIETKKSYQFLGFQLVDFDDWINFLAHGLINSNVTRTPDDQPNKHEMFGDYRYIGYSLLRRSTGLRITTKGSKTFEPKVLSVIT